MKLRHLKSGIIVLVISLTVSFPFTTYATISVDIVDGSLVTVASPSITFSSAGFDWIAQQTTGTMGTSFEQIYIVKTGTVPNKWTLALAAASGSGALWQGATYNYDYNGTASAGRLQIDASEATITPTGSCTTTGLTKGGATYFEQGVNDSITLIDADQTSDNSCSWLITGVSSTQDIPASQEGDNYTIDMVLTVS